MFRSIRSIIVAAVCVLALGMLTAPSPVFAAPTAETADTPLPVVNEDPVRGLALPAVPSPRIRRLPGDHRSSLADWAGLRAIVPLNSLPPECLGASFGEEGSGAVHNVHLVTDEAGCPDYIVEGDFSDEGWMFTACELTSTKQRSASAGLAVGGVVINGFFSVEETVTVCVYGGCNTEYTEEEVNTRFH